MPTDDWLRRRNYLNESQNSFRIVEYTIIIRFLGCDTIMNYLFASHFFMSIFFCSTFRSLLFRSPRAHYEIAGAREFFQELRAVIKVYVITWELFCIAMVQSAGLPKNPLYSRTRHTYTYTASTRKHTPTLFPRSNFYYFSCTAERPLGDSTRALTLLAKMSWQRLTSMKTPSFIRTEWVTKEGDVH